MNNKTRTKQFVTSDTTALSDIILFISINYWVIEIKGEGLFNKMKHQKKKKKGLTDVAAESFDSLLQSTSCLGRNCCSCWFEFCCHSKRPRGLIDWLISLFAYWFVRLPVEISEMNANVEKRFSRFQAKAYQKKKKKKKKGRQPCLLQDIGIR